MSLCLPLLNLTYAAYRPTFGLRCSMVTWSLFACAGACARTTTHYFRVCRCELPTQAAPRTSSPTNQQRRTQSVRTIALFCCRRPITHNATGTCSHFRSRQLPLIEYQLTSSPQTMAPSAKTKKPAGKTQRSAIADVVAREYTIHLHKRVC